MGLPYQVFDDNETEPPTNEEKPSAWDRWKWLIGIVVASIVDTAIFLALTYKVWSSWQW